MRGLKLFSAIASLGAVVCFTAPSVAADTSPACEPQTVHASAAGVRFRLCGGKVESIENVKTGVVQGGPGELFVLGKEDGSEVLSSHCEVRRLDVPSKKPRAGQGSIVHAASVRCSGAADGTVLFIEQPGGAGVRVSYSLTPTGPVLKTFFAIRMPWKGTGALPDVAGYPLEAEGFIAGLEHPLAEAEATSLKIAAPLAQAGDRLTAVAGIIALGRESKRRTFLKYLDTIRKQPYRQYLHYNTWYDIAWADRKFDEPQTLERIDRFCEELHAKRRVEIDGFVLDDGWDDRKSLWAFHSGFPRGFSEATVHANACGAGIGTWLSPWGGYDQALEDRKAAAAERRYRTTKRGFTLDDPAYYEKFKDIVLDMVGRQAVRYLKIDGVGSGLGASGREPESVADIEALLELLAFIRVTEPRVFINLTVGSWPSPYWLQSVDTLWRGGSDSGTAGVGSTREQWITFRDAELYKNVVLRAPLFPITSVMLHGIQRAQLGHPTKLSYTPEEFEHEVWSFFGSGVELQELYLSPELLTARDWDVVADAARWARERSKTLSDSHWIGGDPEKGEVYGFASWNGDWKRGTVLLRNPSGEERTVPLNLGAWFEDGFSKPPALESKYLSPGSAVTAENRVKLPPFGVALFDTVL